jgi:hypothetical protein
LQRYVQSEEFDRECAAQSWKAFKRASVSDDGDSDYSQESFWSSSDDTFSDISSGELFPYEVSRLEAYVYYAGLSPDGRGPKLVYRTSTDEFVPPNGPEAYKRLMKLSPVPEDHKLGQDGLWDSIRDQARGRLYV